MSRGPVPALLAGLVTTLLFTTPAAAQVLTTIPYIPGGLSAPVGMVQDPSDPTVQFVVEQTGLIRVIKNGALQAGAFVDLTDESLFGGERGLLGLAFPTDYARTRRFYVHFTREPDGATVITRFLRSESNPLVADEGSRFDLLWPAMPDANCSQLAEQRIICQPFANHNGGKLSFGPDGYLYIAMGDGGAGNDPANQAQRPGTLLGKILRVDVSVPDTDIRGYRIPPDNPFAGADALGALDEIWAFGVRNAWRLTFDEVVHGGTGALTFGDVGQSGADSREEFNYEPGGKGGRNYGWARMEGSRDHLPGPTAFLPLRLPVHEYSRSIGASITGGYVYRGASLGVGHQGRYFLGDFITGRMFEVTLSLDPATGEVWGVPAVSDVSDALNPVPPGASARPNISSIDVDFYGEMYIVRYSGSIVKVVASPTSDANRDGLPDDWTPWHRRFLGEGASSAFFDTTIAIANPNFGSATVRLLFLREGAPPIAWPVTVAGHRRLTVSPSQLLALQDWGFSTFVDSDFEVVVERTMRWGGEGYGAHTDKAIHSTSREWHFAEGAQGFFFTYLLLTNPETTADVVDVTFLPEGEPSFTIPYPIQPLSRLTVDIAQIPALVNRSFGMKVTFRTNQGIAERAMYFGLDPVTPFRGGHVSAGVTTPSVEWFLPEGATGPFFETFILAANPNASDVVAVFTFITDSGQAVTVPRTIPANSRQTVNPEALGEPALANAAVATRVTSQGLPIVVERAQYWPFAAPFWYEAHNSFGVPASGIRWALAEGEAGRASSAQSYILLANNGSTPATVTIQFLREVGPQLIKTFVVPAGTRFNVRIGGAGADVPELAHERFGVVITSTQPIAVERAMYGNAGTVIWDLGTSATATPLP